MGIFTSILVVLWLLKSLLLTPLARQSLSPGEQFSIDLLTFLLIVPAVYYVWKLFALVRRKLLWKIRRRLVLAHVFVGAIPALFLFFIFSASALLFYYQLTYYLISNQIGIHAGQIHAFNLSLRSQIDQLIGANTTLPSNLRSIFDSETQYLLSSYPTASLIFRLEGGPARGGTVLYANKNVNHSALPDYQVPRWAGEREFSGLIFEDSQPLIYVPENDGAERARAGRLYLRSLVFSDLRPELPYSIEISVPFDRYLLERLKAAMGQDLLLADRVNVTSLNVMLQTTEILQRNVLSSTFDLQGSPEAAGRSLWSIMLFPISWNSGTEINKLGEAQVLFVELSTSKLFHNVFRTENNVSKTILGVLQIVVGFFLLVELISLVIGILLTKSITSAVYNLDRGTQFVKRGDFSHRIVVKSADQLGALAESFNQMTEYVQTLVKERVQKERLERELEIAKEVQEQLFPHKAPRMGKMELTGLCLPARVVSGDYYDFLQLNFDRVGMALGDICGKGISAALLMANLQATLRSNVSIYLRDAGTDLHTDDGAGGVSHVVKRINEQIYHHTSANKFASFFYAVYDERNTSLTYCNAGHNPPIFLTRDGCRRLTTGGTVVGIFPDADYQEETLQLEAGDLFLAYTDGIVESVNEYGEEFGEDRLIRLIEENRSSSAEQIQRVVVERVLEWAYEEERDDDMTLIVARFA
jgi:sigma-B regulation protein RsbU (phosphoserine phosphatase)